MPTRLDWLWRLAATGFSFGLFGVGSILLWVVLFPALQPFLGTGRVRHGRARLLMHRVFRFYVAVMQGLGLFRFDPGDTVALNRGSCIIAADHPSLLDIVLLIAVIRNATCIVKPALFRNPVMRAPIRAMDYLYAADPEELLDRCVAQLHEGSALIIFPQGTRTPVSEPGPYQRGVANIALKSGLPIVPVHIDCVPPTLSKHDKWYQIPPTRVLFRFRVGEPLDPNRYTGAESRARAARNLTLALEHAIASLAGPID